MSSENIGVEEARKILGDLVTKAEQGTDIILTRRGRPAARLTRYQEDTMAVDLAELTKRFGLPDHEQSAVSAWTGDPYGTTWSEEEAEVLRQAWEADTTSDEAAEDEAVARIRYELVDEGGGSETSRVVAVDPETSERRTVFTGPTAECQDYIEHETEA